MCFMEDVKVFSQLMGSCINNTVVDKLPYIVLRMMIAGDSKSVNLVLAACRVKRVWVYCWVLIMVSVSLSFSKIGLFMSKSKIFPADFVLHFFDLGELIWFHYMLMDLSFDSE